MQPAQYVLGTRSSVCEGTCRPNSKRKEANGKPNRKPAGSQRGASGRGWAAPTARSSPVAVDLRRLLAAPSYATSSAPSQGHGMETWESAFLCVSVCLCASVPACEPVPVPPRQCMRACVCESCSQRPLLTRRDGRRWNGYTERTCRRIQAWADVRGMRRCGHGGAISSAKASAGASSRRVTRRPVSSPCPRCLARRRLLRLKTFRDATASPSSIALADDGGRFPGLARRPLTRSHII